MNDTTHFIGCFARMLAEPGSRDVINIIGRKIRPETRLEHRVPELARAVNMVLIMHVLHARRDRIGMGIHSQKVMTAVDLLRKDFGTGSDNRPDGPVDEHVDDLTALFIRENARDPKVAALNCDFMKWAQNPPAHITPELKETA